MRCIFCDKSSEGSKSVEHIIPESLGNTKAFLPKGVVCDKCNNYFAIKIEKPLLDSLYFKDVRLRNDILTKRGRRVPDELYTPFGKIEAEIEAGDNEATLNIAFKNVNNILFEKIASNNVKQFQIRIPTTPMHEPQEYFMSRFLAKCSLEYLTTKVVQNENWYEFIGDGIFNPLRNYARYGKGEYWPYDQRRIHSENKPFLEDNNYVKPVQRVWEMEIQLLDLDFMPHKNIYAEEITGQMYFHLVYMGIEYTFNMAGPEIQNYKEWLSSNHDKNEIV